MFKRFFVLLLCGMCKIAVASDITTQIYKLTDESFTPVYSPTFQIFNACDGFYTYGYSCHKIATIEASVGYPGILSIDPFVSAIRKSAASLGANAILKGDTDTVVKNTQAYLKVSATAYRVVYKNGQLYTSDDPTQEYILPFDLAAAKSTIDQKEALGKLETFPYNEKRNAIIFGERDAFLERFFMVTSSAGVVGLDTEISDLSEQQLDKLEKFIKRIPADTIRETIARDSDLFTKEIYKTALPRLKKLKGQYPRDYAEFRKLYKALYIEDLIEQDKPASSKNPQAKTVKK